MTIFINPILMVVPVNNWYTIAKAIDEAHIVVARPDVQIGVAHVQAHANSVGHD